jgi:hypothetical protein
MKLTTHFHLVPRLRMNRVILLLPLHAVILWIRTSPFHCGAAKTVSNHSLDYTAIVWTGSQCCLDCDICNEVHDKK